MTSQQQKAWNEMVGRIKAQDEIDDEYEVAILVADAELRRLRAFYAAVSAMPPRSELYHHYGGWEYRAPFAPTGSQRGKGATPEAALGVETVQS